MRKRRSRGFRPLWDHLDDRCLLSGYTPAQVTAAYGLNAISFRSASGATVTGDGTGQTIAIVEMYHDPNIQASLNVFDAQYNLPNITLDVINQAGAQTDDGWAEEESLDVEWAHAIAPGAKIVVVESSPGTTARTGIQQHDRGRPNGQPDGRGHRRLHELGLRRVPRRGVLRLQLHDLRGHLSRLQRRQRLDRMARDVVQRRRRRRDLAESGPLGRLWVRDRLGRHRRRSQRDPGRAGLSERRPIHRRPEHARRLLRRRPLYGRLDLRHPGGSHRGLGTVGGRRRHERRRTGLGRDHRDRQPGPRRGRAREPDRFHSDPAGALRPLRDRIQQGARNIRRRWVEPGDQHRRLQHPGRPRESRWASTLVDALVNSTTTTTTPTPSPTPNPTPPPTPLPTPQPHSASGADIDADTDAGLPHRSRPVADSASDPDPVIHAAARPRPVAGPVRRRTRSRPSTNTSPVTRSRRPCAGMSRGDRG